MSKTDFRTYSIDFTPDNPTAFIVDNYGTYPELDELRQLRDCCNKVLRAAAAYQKCKRNRDHLFGLLGIENYSGPVVGFCDCPYCLSFHGYVKDWIERDRSAKTDRTKSKQRKTTIYLASNRFGEYKIGQAIDVPFREKTLQSEDPEFRIISSWDGKSSDEKYLHDLFKQKRKRGEWFVLDEADVRVISDYFEAIR